MLKKNKTEEAETTFLPSNISASVKLLRKANQNPSYYFGHRGEHSSCISKSEKEWKEQLKQLKERLDDLERKLN